MTTSTHPLNELRKTARWLRTPMAATMTAMDLQIRGSDSDGLVPGSHNPDDVAALAGWIGEHYGRRPTGTTLETIGADVADWYATELYQTRPVMITAEAWSAVDRLTRSATYLNGVGNQWEPAVPTEPAFAGPGITVLLDGGAPIASSFQDITPGAVPEQLAAITATTDGDSWSVTEWCDATTALGSLDTAGFTEMADAAEKMAPWSIGGSYLTATSGTAAQFATSRIKAAVLALHTEPPATALTPIALLSILFDAVTMGLLRVTDLGDRIQVGPPERTADPTGDPTPTV